VSVMKIKEAIEILDAHNRWRRWRGKGQGPAMQDVNKIGEAIDLIVAKYRKRTAKPKPE